MISYKIAVKIALKYNWGVSWEICGNGIRSGDSECFAENNIGIRIFYSGGNLSINSRLTKRM